MTLPKSPNTSGLTSRLPASVYGPSAQNPAPFGVTGQVDADRVRALADQIVTVFLNSLPSNYVAQSKGPYYVQQFQSAAEELAKIQVLLTDAYEDTDFDFTRSEVLFQFLATLVFPDASVTGIPEIGGDITYREFLKRMVALLLQGSKVSTLVSGVEALTDANVSIIEKGKFVGVPGVAWTLADQFTFEVDISKYRKTASTSAIAVALHYHTVTVNVSGTGTTVDAVYDAGTGPSHTHPISGFLVESANGVGQDPHVHDLLSDFADLPLVLQSNVALILQALDPAHTLYEYRNLFRETLDQAFTDTLGRVDLSDYRYEDVRRDCTGTKELSGSGGIVLADRYMFNDPTLSFRSVRVGATLLVPVVPAPAPSTHLPREHRYEVKAVLTFPYGDDVVARAYTTSPTGLSGNATVEEGAFVDALQDFSLAVPGEVLTFATGPNAGSYLLETVLGLDGGPVGDALGPSTSVRPAPSILRVAPRFTSAGGGVAYTVEVDRLGIRRPIVVTNEDAESQFYSPGGPFSTLQVARGPLVKGWGDGTPASKYDVTVLYDAAPVTVSAINPFTGLITLAAPIAGFAPGAHTVTVSYSWFPAPVQGLRLNTMGLTLNKWDLKGGRHTTSSGVGLPGGGADTTRFPMAVALGRYPRRNPALQVAHRYLAFEKGYTAALNSPTTLLLNQSPGRVNVPYAVADVGPQSFSFDGGMNDPSSPWVSVGNPQGSAPNGIFTLTDNDPSSVSYWKQDFPLPISTSVSIGARLQVTQYTLDGVFTGVGFGFHNNRRLFFAGALVVTNPVTGTSLRHIGLLARPGELSSQNSWVIGPQAEGTILARTGVPPVAQVVTIPTGSVPTLLAAGDKFQILTGTQTGVYTVVDIFQSTTGVTAIGVTPVFPADPELFGNRDVTIYFETKWDEGPCTWRLYANTRSQTAQVVFGGTSGASLSIGAVTLASPAYLGPDVLPEGYGRAVWGSLDRVATNATEWQFIRYQATPDGAYAFSRGTVIDTTMTQDPEDAEWYLTTPFGDSALDAGALRITSTPAIEGLGTSYGYGYTDPFLTGRRVSALDAKVSVARDTYGIGGATLTLQDTHRQAELSSILYQDNGGFGKSIYRSDTLSLVGSVPYYLQTWDAVVGTGITEPSTFPNGPEYLLTSVADTWSMFNTLTPYYAFGVGRFLEFRMAITSFVGGAAGRIGLSLLAQGVGVQVCLDFVATDTIVLRGDPTTAAIATVAVPWSDGAQRTYRLEFETGAITLYVDNVVAVILAPGAFPGPSTLLGDVEIRAYPAVTSQFEASLRGLCFGITEFGVLNLHRSFGLYLGGDKHDINNWKIPRTDGLTVANSDPLSVITEMDWRSECWVRVFMDPTFGASFVRPDLAPPPGYTGDFATQSMDPSAGWVTLDYMQLPRVTSDEKFGSVVFGALNPASSVLSTWDDVRYRVFTNISVDYRAPQSMVLNRWNVISSGDRLKDMSPEEVVVASTTDARISLRPCHIYADRVFAVRVDNVTLPTNLWRFNRDSQEVSLLGITLPSSNYPVNVVFAAGRPVTTTYLQSQPLRESQTLLNEGTPPVPMSQTGIAVLDTDTVSTVSGDGGLTPAFPPAVPADPNYFLRDQYLVRKYENDPDYLYERMSFFQLDDGGDRSRISSFCDGSKMSGVGFSGTTFSENFVGVGQVDRGRGPGTSRFVLFASGGVAGGADGELGLIGPAIYTAPFSGDPNPAATGVGPAMLYPTAPATGTVPGVDTGAIYREVTWILRYGAAPGAILTDSDPPALVAAL
ncbi:MAG: hypothetical protein A3J97_07710 [Spirochaetes bacterium RIFOXYC1_FULL_54_7]|nr:MAG: hypothetical protein A3J97_07710 [Spirochaetes bacterium RIFOXYC1_FULL_54_7]